MIRFNGFLPLARRERCGEIGATGRSPLLCVLCASAVKSTSRLKLVPFLIKIISTEDNRARARNAPLPDGAALQGGIRACRAPFARAAAARPSPKGLDLCSLREHGKNQ